MVGEVMNFLTKDGKKFEDMSGDVKQKADSCVICMCDFESDSPVAELNCASGHVFHVECLE